MYSKLKNIVIYITVFMLILSLSLTSFADETVEEVPIENVDLEFSGVRGSNPQEWVIFGRPVVQAPVTNPEVAYTFDLGPLFNFSKKRSVQYYWDLTKNPTYSLVKGALFQDNKISWTFTFNPYKGSYITGSFSFLNMRAAYTTQRYHFYASQDGENWVYATSIGGDLHMTQSSEDAVYSVDYTSFGGWQADNYNITCRKNNMVIDLSGVSDNSYKYFKVETEFIMNYPASFPPPEYAVPENYNKYYNIIKYPYDYGAVQYHYTFEEAMETLVQDISDNVSSINQGVQATVQGLNTVNGTIQNVGYGIISQITSSSNAIINHIVHAPTEYTQVFDDYVGDVTEFTEDFENRERQFLDAGDQAVEDLNISGFQFDSSYDEFRQGDLWSSVNTLLWSNSFVSTMLVSVIMVAVVGFIITGKVR